MRWLLFALILPLISSCSSIKPYPVCFYDEIPPSSQTKKGHADSLLSVIRRYDPEAKSSINNRWIFAKTNCVQHNNLIQIWPRIACIGSVRSGTDVSRTADCVNYINNFLSDQNYLLFDVKEDIFLSDEAPGKPNVICHCEP